MYQYIDNYVNANHVTHSAYPPPPPAPPLPPYSSDLVVSFICKAQNCCRKYCTVVILPIVICFHVWSPDIKASITSFFIVVVHSSIM